MATSSTSVTDEIISGQRGGTSADASAAQGQRQVDATWAGGPKQWLTEVFGHGKYVHSYIYINMKA